MSDFFNRAWFVAWYSQIITINIPIMYAILTKTKKVLARNEAGAGKK